MEAHSATMEAQAANVVALLVDKETQLTSEPKAHPEDVESSPGALVANPADMKAQPEAIDAHPKKIWESKPGDVEALPGA